MTIRNLVSLGFSIFITVILISYLPNFGSPELNLNNIKGSVEKMRSSIEDPTKMDRFDQARGVLGLQCGFKLFDKTGGPVDLDDPDNSEIVKKHCAWLEGLTVEELIQLAEKRTEKNLFEKY